MKKMKFLGALLFSTILWSTCGQILHAEETVCIQFEQGSRGYVCSQTVQEDAQEVEIDNYYAGDIPNVNFWDQLNEEEKRVYEMLDDLPPTYQARTVHLSSPIKVPLVVTSCSKYNITVNFAQPKEVANTVGALCQNAIDAVRADYPNAFWLGAGEGGIRYQYGTDPISLDTDNVKVGDIVYSQISEVQLSISSKFGDGYQMAHDELYAVNDYMHRSKGVTPYEKVKEAHDYLCAVNTYNLNGEYAHEAYGALVDFNPVCEGYAKAFKYLCDLQDVPCVLVSGYAVGDTVPNGKDGHMWNEVMLDEKWYAVDVTWDDNDIISYDYFLKGANSFNDGQHIASGDFSNSGYKEFSYPELTANDYGAEEEPTIPQNQYLGVIETPMDTKVSDVILVSGWYASTGDIDHVDVLVNDCYLGQAVRYERIGLQELIPGYKASNAGFAFAIDTKNLADGRYDLQVRAYGKDGSYSEQVKEMVVSNLSEISRHAGAIDLPRDGEVISGYSLLTGWTASTVAINKVEVLVNGVYLGDAVRYERPGMQQYLPGFDVANCGFAFGLFSDNFVPGDYTFTIKSYGVDGSVGTVEKQVTIGHQVLQLMEEAPEVEENQPKEGFNEADAPLQNPEQEVLIPEGTSDEQEVSEPEEASDEPEALNPVEVETDEQEANLVEEAISQKEEVIKENEMVMESTQGENE